MSCRKRKTDQETEKNTLRKELDETQEKLGKREKEIEKLKEELEKREKEHSKELEDIKNDHPKELEKIKKEHSKKLEEIEEQHSKELEKIKKEHPKEMEKIKEIKKKHSKELEEIKKEHSNELKKIKKEHSKELKKIKKEHSNELEEIKKEHSKEIEKITKELEKTKDDKERLQDQNKTLRKISKGKDAGASASPHTDKEVGLMFSAAVTPLGGEGSPTDFGIPAQKCEATDMSQGPKQVETCKQVGANNRSETPRDPISVLKTGEGHNYDSKSRNSVQSTNSSTVQKYKEPKGKVPAGDRHYHNAGPNSGSRPSNNYEQNKLYSKAVTGHHRAAENLTTDDEWPSLAESKNSEQKHLPNTNVHTKGATDYLSTSGANWNGASARGDANLVHSRGERLGSDRADTINVGLRQNCAFCSMGYDLDPAKAKEIDNYQMRCILMDFQQHVHGAEINKYLASYSALTSNWKDIVGKDLVNAFQRSGNREPYSDDASGFFSFCKNVFSHLLEKIAIYWKEGNKMFIDELNKRDIANNVDFMKFIKSKFPDLQSHLVSAIYAIEQKKIKK
ncbi:J domain-containing protein DDB_G0295729-like [Mya arenaria]|uniref:J domain-containing protein DDB_G0295729-like n=1 Tax=Mya arenaria TaxID=6604 RepID=UPI0022E25C88|nr:J domain-containing protein DDB_G0295729-like [Mya arenaria]